MSRSLRTVASIAGYSALVCALVGVGYVSFMVLAPCEFHQTKEIAQIKRIASAVKRFKKQHGRLPQIDQPGDMSRLAVPAAVRHWYAIESDGSFTVTTSTPIGMMSFDGPWAQYSSSSDLVACHVQ